MNTLIKTLINHIEGISGMTNPMILKLLDEEFSTLSNAQRCRLQAILSNYLTDTDEDVVNATEFILSRLYL